MSILISTHSGCTSLIFQIETSHSLHLFFESEPDIHIWSGIKLITFPSPKLIVPIMLLITFL